jgi:hypothetical protein
VINSVIGGSGVQVHNGHGGGIYVSGDFYQMGQGIPGELRMLGNTLYVWTNSCWNPITNPSTIIELTQEVQSLLDWARTAKSREDNLKKLAEKYPSVQTAIDNVNTAQAQLELISALVYEHE